MATLQRPIRKTKLPTTTTEQVETEAETALPKGTGGGGRDELVLREAEDHEVVNGHDNGFVGLTEKEFANFGLTEKELASFGLTEKELAKLRPTSHITDVGGAYCPNPKSDGLLRGYETLVTAIQRHPEMRKIEKTDVIKEIHYEDQIIRVPKTRMTTHPVERIDQVIVVRKVAKTVPKTFYRVVEEVREVTEMVEEVEYINVPRIEMESRIITEYVEEKVSVPVVREVLDKYTVEVPTGKFCKYSLGDFNFIEGDLHHDFKSDDDGDLASTVKKDADVPTTVNSGPRPLSVGA